MTTKTATLVRNLGNPGRAAHFVEQRLYQLDPPMRAESWGDEPPRSYKYVVVSAADLTSYFSGPETYIFGSDSTGGIDSFSELDGSFQGALDHEQALQNAGYEVVDPNVIDAEYTVSSAQLEVEAS
jgi:hypothetical protein